MGSVIPVQSSLKATGRCIVTSRSAFNGQITDIQIADNMLFTVFKNAVVKDLAYNLRTSTPKVMAFSRDVVPTSPQPTSFTNEFRTGVSLLADGNKFQIIAVLGSSEGNSGGGNIKTIGFYMGSDATLVLGTGTLCSIINTLNVAKTSALQVTFQYEITLT
jgi:hypothetical protein